MALGLKSYQVGLTRMPRSEDGPKTLEEKERTKDVYYVTKVRGFSLKSQTAKSELTNDKFEHFVKSLLTKTPEKCHVPHFNILREKTSRQLYSTINRKLFRNDVFNQRVAFKNYAYTLPYGYDETLYLKYVTQNPFNAAP